MRSKLLYFLLLLPALCLAQTKMDGHFKIYDSAQKKVISYTELLNKLKDVPVVFFGEEHNDSTGHYLQYQLFQDLHKATNGRTILSMEMFETDVQGVLDEYLQGLIRENIFITDSRAWKNYKDYRPMVEFAKENGIPVIAANAPKRYTNMVTRMGLESLQRLSPAAKNLLPPLPIDTATGRYYEKFIETMGGHISNLKIYQSQNLWDATMAYSIAKYITSNKGGQVLQLNGWFHSGENLGAVSQFNKKYGKGIRTRTITSFSDQDFSNPDWAAKTVLGDYIVITDPTVKRSY